MYNIPKTWCFCSTWTRRPTGCVQTTRNVGGFIEKKRCPPCETEWSSMPLRASRKSVSCVWWKARSVHWRARIPFFFFWKPKPASRKHTKFALKWSLKNLVFFFGFGSTKFKFFFSRYKFRSFWIGIYFSLQILEPEAVPMFFNATFWNLRDDEPGTLDLSCDSWLFDVVWVHWDDILEIILTPKEWESLDQTNFSRFFWTFKEEYYVNLWGCSSDLYLVCCFASFLAGGKMWEPLSSFVYDCHPHVSDAFLCERIYWFDFEKIWGSKKSTDVPRLDSFPRGVLFCGIFSSRNLTW